MSGKLRERPQGRRLFDLLRSGDTLVVRWVDRLGRLRGHLRDHPRVYAAITLWRARRERVPYARSNCRRRPRPPSSKKDLKARVVGLTIGCREGGPGRARGCPRGPQSPLCLLGVPRDNATRYSIYLLPAAFSRTTAGPESSRGCRQEGKRAKGTKGANGANGSPRPAYPSLVDGLNAPSSILVLPCARKPHRASIASMRRARPASIPARA